MIPEIYKTSMMLGAIERMEPQATFLRDRYFPTNPSTDLFSTERVLIDYRDGRKVMAPCVIPRVKGITMARDGFKTKDYAPPYIAPKRTLYSDDLESRGFGEAIMGDKSPAERAAILLGNDLSDLDKMISAREEFIAAQCMLNNGYILRHFADGYGGSEYEDFEIRFHDEPVNPSTYTPGDTWLDAPARTIYDDINQMILMLKNKGLGASDMIVSPDVSAEIINNAEILERLGFTPQVVGDIDPKALSNGATFVGKLNVYGNMINVLAYGETYIDDITGKVEQLIPAGCVIVTSPASGRGLYGAVTQMEDDKQYHTRTGKRIPKYHADVDADIRTLRVASRPLYIPRNANPWVSAKVLW